MKVMGTLRNKTKNTKISPKKPPVSKRSALIVMEDDYLDDWLEDDLQASRVTKKRKTGATSSLLTPAVRSSGPKSGNTLKKSSSPCK